MNNTSCTPQSQTPIQKEVTFITETELADRWRLSTKILQKWRVAGGGPRFHKFGSAVRYAITDVAHFEEKTARENTSQ